MKTKAAAVAVFGMALLAPLSSPAQDVTSILRLARARARPADRPLVIGHRGAGSDGPENTLLSIEKGFAAGADAVEFDVQLSKDGVVMLLHDVAVNRITKSAKGCVADFTKDELQGMTLLDGDGRDSPERFATLADALALLKSHRYPAENDLEAVVHIKSYDGLFGDMPGEASGFLSTLLCPKTDYRALVEKTLALVRAAGLEDKVLFASTDRRVLAAIRARKGDARVALISSSPKKALAFSSERGYGAVLLKYGKTTRADLRSAKARGVAVYVWSPDTVAEIEPFVGWADGVIANSVPAALAARASGGD